MVKLNEQEKKQKLQEETKKVVEPKSIKKNKKVKEEKPIKVDLSLEDLEVILFPLVTEKAVNMIDSENKITFVVSNKATKKSVKQIIEKAYNIKTEKINIIRDMKGRKKAIIKLRKDYKAQDLATKLGVL